ncbi:MAG: hypothetical protein Kow00121_25450 [Elainellaceae cyanobacterium]
MFNPTHFLVSRSRKTPVQLVPSNQGFKVLTEPEWQRGSEAAFEIRARQGFFCQGVPVVGYSLQPIHQAEAASVEEQNSTQSHA